MPNAGRFPVAVGSYGAAEPRHGARARPVPRQEQGGPPDFSENFQEEEAGGPQGAKATGHRQWLGAPQTAPDQARPQLRRLRHPGPAQAERDGADGARPADARVQSARWPGGRRLLGENPRRAAGGGRLGRRRRGRVHGRRAPAVRGPVRNLFRPEARRPRGPGCVDEAGRAKGHGTPPLRAGLCQRERRRGQLRHGGRHNAAALHGQAPGPLVGGRL
mmetsp:Transcript_9102/g.31343  ORF Transcript_9102/g.31343 Transcript_9102/m.31343 type:complete len:218 (-) Transcript_9102:7471-8124(-)